MNNSKLSFDIVTLLGSSSKRINQIACLKQVLIYVCGSYLIFYSPILDEQIAYIKHRTENISAICVSPNQKYLAVAQTGKYPNIFIYNIQKTVIQQYKVNQKPIWILKGHKISIDLIIFSPNSKYLVSICNSECSMFIWENGQAITKNKISKQINKIMFDHNQDLITIGRGYFKVWKFDKGNIIRKKQGDYFMIQGKVINFGKKFNTKQFVDSCLYRSNKEEQFFLILLSADGQLCVIQNNYQKISKWIDLMIQNSTSLQIIGDIALCGGDNALVKIINLSSLSCEGNFPKPPPTNKQNIQKDQLLQYKQNQTFSKCIGILIFNNYILTLYQNLTMFIWKMAQQITAIRSIITHKEKINCVCLLQEIKGDITFFGTASQDNTLRIWHFYKKCYGNNKQSLDIAEIIGIKRNAYCKNLTRIIYTDSQHPIIKMKMFMSKYIVCISKQEFLMYSLQNFQLVLHQNFQEQFKTSRIKSQCILSLQVNQNLIYLGFQNGFLKIYKPSEDSLLKMKELDIGTSIQQIKFYDKKKLIIKGKTKIFSYNIETQQKIAQQNIQTYSISQNYLILGEKKKIIFFSIQKNKKTSQISLTHQIDPDQEIKLIKASSRLIALITNKQRLIITSYQTIMYSEMMNEQIIDLEISQNGEILMVGSEGNIVIKAINDAKYLKIEQKVKKWFQMNDMSWLDNSVWSHSKNQTYSSIKNNCVQKSNNNNQYSFNSIQNAKSIKIGNSLSDQSIRLYELPNVQLQYKNQNNKMSVFNPANIIKQMKQVNNVVKGVMKNRQQKNIDFSNSIQKIDLEKDVNSRQKQKKRIFNQKKQQFAPKFGNNLVQSYIHEENIQPKKNINPKINDEILTIQKVIPQTKTIASSNTFMQKQVKKQISKNKHQNDQEHSFLYSKSRESQTLRYSSNENYINKQEQVRNSLQLFSKNGDKQILPISIKKNTQKNLQQHQRIVQTFREILTTIQESQQYVDKPYIKSLINQNKVQFKKLYLILGEVLQPEREFGKNQINQKQIDQIRNQQRKKVLLEYQKMSFTFIQFLKK